MDNELLGRKIGHNNTELLEKCRALKERGLPSEEVRAGIRELFKEHQTKQAEIFREYVESL